MEIDSDYDKKGKAKERGGESVPMDSQESSSDQVFVSLLCLISFGFEEMWTNVSTLPQDLIVPFNYVNFSFFLS